MVSIDSSTPLSLFAPRETPAPSRGDTGDHADFSFELAAADRRAETPEAAPVTPRKSDAGRKAGSDVATKPTGTSSSGTRTSRTDRRKEDRADDAKDETKDTAPTTAQTEKPAAEPAEKSSGAALEVAEPQKSEVRPAVEAPPASAAAPVELPAVPAIAKAELPAQNINPVEVRKSDPVPGKVVAPKVASEPVTAEAVAPKPEVPQAVRSEKPVAQPTPAASLKGRSLERPEPESKQKSVDALKAAAAAAPQVQSQPAPAVEDGGKQAQADVKSLVGAAANASATGAPKIESEARTKSDAALAFAVRLSDRQADAGAPALKSPATAPTAKQPAGFQSELPPAPQQRSAGNAEAASKSALGSVSNEETPIPGAQAGTEQAAGDLAAAKPTTPLHPQVSEHFTERKTATEDTPAATVQPAQSSAPAPALSAQPTVTESAPVHRTAAPETPVALTAQEAPATSAAQRPSEPLRDISVRIAADGDSRVDVRLTDRAGELRIEVRTPDTHLNKSLRDGLPELAERLETAGRTNQVWRPADSGASLSDHGSRESQSQSWSSQSQNNSRQNQQSGNDGGRRGRQNSQEEPAGGQEESFAAYLRQGKGTR